MKKMRWLQTVDRLMKRDWCIDTADARLHPAELTRYDQNGEEPSFFVAWFAAKHDLIRFEPRHYFRPGETNL